MGTINLAGTGVFKWATIAALAPLTIDMLYAGISSLLS